MRHEGVPPSNNLIKDGTHRATVFVGPTLKSFPFLFFRADSTGAFMEVKVLNRKFQMVQLKLTHPKSDKIIFVDFKKAKRGR